MLPISVCNNDNILNQDQGYAGGMISRMVRGRRVVIIYDDSDSDSDSDSEAKGEDKENGEDSSGESDEQEVRFHLPDFPPSYLSLETDSKLCNIVFLFRGGPGEVPGPSSCPSSPGLEYIPLNKTRPASARCSPWNTPKAAAQGKKGESAGRKYLTSGSCRLPETSSSIHPDENSQPFYFRIVTKSSLPPTQGRFDIFLLEFNSTKPCAPSSQARRFRSKSNYFH